MSTNYGKPLDVWAIGCIMGELIDGKPLFPGDNELDQLFKIQNVLGPFPPELQGMLTKSGRHAGVNLTTMKGKPETVEKRYLGKISKKALSFLKGTLRLDPNKRMTIEEALEHPYFEDLRESDPYWKKIQQAASSKPPQKPQNEDSARAATALSEKKQNDPFDFTSKAKKNKGDSSASPNPKETTGNEAEASQKNKENSKLNDGSSAIQLNLMESKESAFLEKNKGANMQRMRKKPRFYNVLSIEKDTKTPPEQNEKTPKASQQNKSIIQFDAASIITQNQGKRTTIPLRQREPVQEERHGSGLSQYSHGNTRIRSVKNPVCHKKNTNKRNGKNANELGKSIEKIGAVYIHKRMAMEMNERGAEQGKSGINSVLPYIKKNGNNQSFDQALIHTVNHFDFRVGPPEGPWSHLNPSSANKTQSRVNLLLSIFSILLSPMRQFG